MTAVKTSHPKDETAPPTVVETLEAGAFDEAPPPVVQTLKEGTFPALWELCVELRKELVECQKIRSQVIGFKIAFVSAVYAALAKFDMQQSMYLLVFVVPAIASCCFDYLISSYGFSIKRIGCYIRNVIEKELEKNGSPLAEVTLWETFLKSNPKHAQMSSILGNIGLTVLSVAVGLIAVYYTPAPFPLGAKIVLSSVVLAFLGYSIISALEPRRFSNVIAAKGAHTAWWKFWRL
ncbi:MAG: hypothetical protein ACYDBB_25240 [Armatimonadota bacterium]